MLDVGNGAAIEASFLYLLASRSEQHFASVADGLRAIARVTTWPTASGESTTWRRRSGSWQLAARERPDFVAGWLMLGETALAQNDAAALEEAAMGLEEQPGGAVEAALLRARGLLARGDAAAAREAGRRLVEGHPADVGLKLFLASVLLPEGRAPEAEAVLRDALLLAPDHPGVQRALAAALRQRLATETAVFEAKSDLNGWALAERYRLACATPSDINEHLPALYELAKGCKHVTEMGTRTGVSTLALLAAQPERLVCLDVVRYPEVDQLAAMAGRTQFVFRKEDVLQADIEETDLLFIDTLHGYDQLREELRRHAAKARKYIVLHDTTAFADRGEVEGQRGLWPAVEEFLAAGVFRLKQRYENNNGLTILERV